jgi:hypothetical protein
MHSLQQIDKLLSRPELWKWDRDTVAAALLILRSQRGLSLQTGGERGDLAPAALAIRAGWAVYARVRRGALTCEPTRAGIAFAYATRLAILGEMALSLVDREAAALRPRQMDRRSQSATRWALRAGLRAQALCRVMEAEQAKGSGVRCQTLH